MTAVLEELQTTIRAAAENVGPAVVGLGRGWGLGSGVVVADGRVLTNAHSVRRDEPTVTFADGRSAAGRVAAADADRDLAVIEVDTAGAPSVEWADAAPELGSAVLALANPGGRGLRATLGFVSAAERSFRGPRGRRIAGAIEHTAALPRGSAGGPLVDPEGRLLGINTVRLEGGLILALPADAALRERVESLSRGEAPRAPRLGVAVAPPRVARRMRRAVGLPEREGLLVRAVEDDSPAAQAGLQRGDLIVAAAGGDVDGVDSLYAALDGTVGGTLPLTVVRGAEELELSVEFDGGPTAEAA